MKSTLLTIFSVIVAMVLFEKIVKPRLSGAQPVASSTLSKPQATQAIDNLFDPDTTGGDFDSQVAALVAGDSQ